MERTYADAEPKAVKRVGVLGGGLMGAGISHVSVAKGKYRFVLKMCLTKVAQCAQLQL